MTELERIQQAKAAVANAPGGEMWLEEFLVRGAPGGGIKGGHVTYSWRAADAFGGKTPPQPMAPFPVTIAAGEPAFEAVAAEINLAAIATVAVRDASIAALTEERDALAARLAALEATHGD